jgi:hypothetical protein
MEGREMYAEKIGREKRTQREEQEGEEEQGRKKKLPLNGSSKGKNRRQGITEN